MRASIFSSYMGNCEASAYYVPISFGTQLRETMRAIAATEIVNFERFDYVVVKMIYRGSIQRCIYSAPSR